MKRLATWYKKHERHYSSVALIGGFVIDILTLRRIDALWENSWIIFHLVVVAATILYLSSSTKSSRKEFWARLFMQFSFGGLLSAFLVFYFRSAALFISWPFLLILGIAFMANERLEKYRDVLLFQVSLFFLSLFSFAIFFVPVILGRIGSWVFILSGIVSIVLIRWFFIWLERIAKQKFRDSRKALWSSVLSIFAAMNILYFTNVLPPIPLSLKDGGVYYAVSKVSTDDYVLQKPRHSFVDYVSLYPDVQLFSKNQTLYAYTAIFSPGRFRTGILHEWQKYDEANSRWITTATISLGISGGRPEGFRTYSTHLVSEGKWRVNVLTSNGQVISRIRFEAKTGN